MRLRPREIFALVFLIVVPPGCFAFQPATDVEIARWEQQARNVTIIRDDWGIAHVYGKTDADTVFGAMYAQAEDDFNRVETNYINAMGRLAEAEGEVEDLSGSSHEALHRSRRAEDAIRSQPGMAEEADERLCRWAELLSLQAPRGEAASDSAIRAVDGASFTEGSIGGDIERVNLDQLQAFYGKACRRA